MAAGIKMKWTPELIATVTDLWRQRLSTRVIAAEMGYSHTQIKRIAQRLRLPKRYPKFINPQKMPREKEQKIIAMRRAGVTNKAIKEQLGVGSDSLWRVLGEAGLVVRRGERKPSVPPPELPKRREADEVAPIAKLHPQYGLARYSNITRGEIEALRALALVRAGHATRAA